MRTICLLLKTADGATWTAGSAPPDYSMNGFPGAYLNGIACSTTSTASGGLWVAATSSNEGAAWKQATMDLDSTPADGSAFVTRVRRSTQGTFRASGYYDYLGRSTDGATFAPVTLSVEIQWWNDVEPDNVVDWWAVGEKGNVTTSADDGLTWTTVAVPTTEGLYAVAFNDPMTGLIAGAHGAAFLTQDGGKTWTNVSSGLDGYLGAVVWLDAANVIVAGERGTVLHRTLP